MSCFRYTTYLTGWLSQTIFFSANSILFTFSVVGNGVVIYIVWGKSALKLPTYLLLSFLSMSDLLTSFLGQLPIVVSFAAYQHLSCNMEKFLALMHASSGTSSLLLLSLIARDRHLHASKRQSYLFYTSNRLAITSSISVYLLGMAMAVMYMFQNRTIQILGLISSAELLASLLFAIRAGRS